LFIGFRGRRAREHLAGYAWLLFLIAIALAGGLCTYYYLDEFPALVRGRRGPLLFAGLALAGAVLLVLSAPFLWIAALALRRPIWLTVIKAHAALYTVCLATMVATDTRGHSSPFGGIEDAILGFFYVVLGIEALVGLVVFLTMKQAQAEDPKAPRFIYLGLTASLLGGGFAAILVWSAELPHRVIAAAESGALDRPYCIEVQGKAARSANDLTGLKVYARSSGGFTFSFHALLVIGALTDRTYMNWSFRSGRFEPVTQSAREGLHLDEWPRCSPIPHFARDWSVR
jgi:hypothetical protein